MSHPESFYCPLTHELMRDPVVDPEGNSYERAAIEKWLREREATSPVTRSPLTVSQLVPNRALADVIASVTGNAASPSPPPSSSATDAVVPSDTSGGASEATVTGEDGVTFTLTAALTPASQPLTVDVLCSVKPPKGTARTPSDIVAVVDVSGSMGSAAKMMSQAGSESNGLSLLDIVKHALRTVIHILEPQDRLAVVAFSTNASVVFQLQHMTDGNRKAALREVEKLEPLDTTNLWQGLKMGLELLDASAAPATQGGSRRFGSVLLLTDGKPNCEPPRGHIPMLMRLLDEKPELASVTVSTFAFGYSLDSRLLKQIALLGQGMYSFIPDSGFVGTAFVNSISNLLATMARKPALTLEAVGGAEIVSVVGYDEVTETLAKEKQQPGVASSCSTSRFVPLSSLQYGQSKDVVVRMKVPKAALVSPSSPFLEASVSYLSTLADGTSNLFATLAEVEEGEEVRVHASRLRFVGAVERAGAKAGAHSQMEEELQAVITYVKQHGGCDPRTIALLADLEGEALLACKEEATMRKWGRHYLPSLTCAHLLQQANNFKDPGIQHFGGSLFQAIRDKADDVFCALPPPKPSRKAVSYGRSSGSAVASAPVSMKMYHCASNVCFAGSCLVTMADGSQKAVRAVRKGDVVQTGPVGGSQPATVLCVVRTHCTGGEAALVRLPCGLLVTPYHPVVAGGRWQFPVALADAEVRACESVYSFVLSAGHTLLVDGCECVALGHSFTEEVVRHPYFGSSRVVDDLKQLPAWEVGVLHVRGGCLVREEGVACGIATSHFQLPSSHALLRAAA